VAINVTRDGFPKEHIPALAHAERAYTSNWRFEFGFASCIAIDDTGAIPLSLISGSAKGQAVSQRMHGDQYLELIAEALGRHRRIVEIKRSLFSLDFANASQKIAALTMEIRMSFQQQAMEAMRQRTDLENSNQKPVSRRC